MPKITIGGSGIGDAVMDGAKLLMEKQRLDLLQRKVEQQMAQEDEDRAREEQARQLSGEAIGQLAGIGQPSEVSERMGQQGGNGNPFGGMSPKQAKRQAGQRDFQMKTQASARVLSALAKVDPEAAQKLYGVREKELKELQRNQVMGSIREDLSEALIGEKFNVPLATGQVDPSGSEMAKTLLQMAEDPNADPVKLAQAAGELQQSTTQRKLHEGKKRTRAEKATAELGQRMALESPEMTDRRQQMIQSMLDDEMDPGAFDKAWPDAGVGEQMRQIEMQNAQLKQELLKAQTQETRAQTFQRSPMGTMLSEGARGAREMAVNAARPPGSRGAPKAPEDPEVGAGRRMRNMKDATEAATQELGEVSDIMDSEERAAHGAAIKKRAAQILKEARGDKGNGSNEARRIMSEFRRKKLSKEEAIKQAQEMGFKSFEEVQRAAEKD